MKTYWLHSGA